MLLEYTLPEDNGRSGLRRGTMISCACSQIVHLCKLFWRVEGTSSPSIARPQSTCEEPKRHTGITSDMSVKINRI